MSEKKYWFVFHNHDLLLEKRSDGSYAVPTTEVPPLGLQATTFAHHLGVLDGMEINTFGIEEAEVADDRYELCDLRASYDKLPKAVHLTAGKCAEILYWDITTHYCGVCGAPMDFSTDISKKCPKCGREIWPELATAIIVLVRRGDEVLLVHAKNFRGDFFGLVAGFVETGESLEQAVKREVMEETNIKIRNVRYYKSQPWPYPCGLMVGFFADYESGEIRLQESELSAGAWFRKDNLPEIPGKLSIARMLIDEWLEVKLV